MEFRAFVNNKKLNAMSQYFCFAYSQQLVDEKDEIAKNILAFFDTIKDQIPHTAFVDVLEDISAAELLDVLVLVLTQFHDTDT
jgi:hypothetical protein